MRRYFLDLVWSGAEVVVGGDASSASRSGGIRAVLWTEDHRIRDLGTLGACCAIGGTINERGQILLPLFQIGPSMRISGRMV